MAWIRLVADDEATGPLKQMYDAALARAGRVFGIVRTMSPNPATMEKSMGFYMQIMKGPSGLSRQERELLATVTSRANDCYY
ncbi:MAG: carboxymuconolactone decarboxylase family protein [Planctomycetota bacterium]